MEGFGRGCYLFDGSCPIPEFDGSCELVYGDQDHIVVTQVELRAFDSSGRSKTIWHSTTAIICAPALVAKISIGQLAAAKATVAGGRSLRFHSL